MVKKIMANVILVVVVMILVVSVCCLAGYTTKCLVKISAGLDFSFYRYVAFYLIIFVLMVTMDIFYGVIDRLKNASN